MREVVDLAKLEDKSQVDGLMLMRVIGPIYLANAIESWTFTDGEGSPLPIADADIALPFSVKWAITEAADTLFGEDLLDPLLVMLRKFSQDGQTGDSTSQSRPIGRSRRSPSAPSSPASSEASGQ
jgi:hypothetical protein